MLRLELAMVAARIVSPDIQAIPQQWHSSTLAEDFGVLDADEDDRYAAMDWLLERQESIEQALATRHLCEGVLVLCDLSSSYFGGHRCPLAQRGYSRDGKRGTLQMDTACSPMSVAARWPSRCSMATPPIARASCRRGSRCVSALASIRCSWSATGA
ncbi:hypothetical protein [Verminephrobacter aporrectodeae]|uniref:hypothetical protein n=1 Tax=Verminephrobacter aporrectodeae TaxID=1110389 RepID=UPI002244E6FE|nr:hypothetical protein [Verminephrobacter aporrectodeae]MCW8174665.1 hypothetical protein [Verminephrobacter aporrectodeae subsp. tuberculatae]MCW8201255.1 hypothetical protein [Verminephrobacter aporrectodeae subsp. tuberculatae]